MGGGGVSKNVTLQFLLVILLVKIVNNLCHVTQGREVRGEMSPNATQGGGVQKSVEKVSRIIRMAPLVQLGLVRLG
jgi:hypothetical protein